MKLTLRIKIAAITITIIILSISTNSIINSVIFVHEYTNALGEKAFAAGQSLKIQLDRLLNLHIPLDQLDGFEKQCLDLVNTYDGILYAMVLDTNNEILFHNDASQHGKKLDGISRPGRHLPENKLFKLKDDRYATIYQSRIPIIDGHLEYQGMLIIGFSDGIIKAKRNRMIFASFVTGLFSVAFAVCTLVALIHVSVSMPLNTFISDIQSIRSSETDELQLIKSGSDGEIGLLRKAFNELMVDLNLSNNKVKKYTEKLESEVRARTAELTIANQNLHRDMIAIREAEKALRDSEELRKSFMSSATDGFILYDSNLNILDINKASLDIFGLAETVIGMNMKELFPDVALSGRYEKYVAVMDTGRPFFIDHVKVSSARRELHLSLKAFKVHNGLGVIITDITKQKLAEKEQQKMESQLRQAQKMEAIGTLAGGIAHDFNNILSAIIGYTELALNDAQEGSRLEDHLQEVFNAGMRATDLVKQILAFARQSEEEVKPLQAGLIVKEVLKFMRSSIPATIKITQNIESDSFIMGNATQVHQIVMNLCTNAAQVLDQDGGLIHVSLKDISITSTSSMSKLELNSGDYIQMKVSDSGIGIPPDIIDFIFEPYFTTKAHGKGTGMGLAMVHGIVESYGGKITVDSKLGEGTVFTVYLPITKKFSVSRQYEFNESPSGVERILFVDDEAAIAKMGAQVLEQLGYAVSIRTSSVEALELFRSKADEFDLVITDMTMPNMTGDVLAKEIMKIRSDIPVILCTGYSRKITKDMAEEIGIMAFAYKPFVKSGLAKTIRKVLDRAKGSIQNY